MWKPVTYGGSCPAYDTHRIWALRNTGTPFERLNVAVDDRTDGYTSTVATVVVGRSLQDHGSSVGFWAVAVEEAGIDHTSPEMG